MVGQAGLEPAMPSAPDLQSGGVTIFLLTHAAYFRYQHAQRIAFNSHLVSRSWLRQVQSAYLSSINSSIPRLPIIMAEISARQVVLYSRKRNSLSYLIEKPGRLAKEFFEVFTIFMTIALTEKANSGHTLALWQRWRHRRDSNPRPPA